MENTWREGKDGVIVNIGPLSRNASYFLLLKVGLNSQ